MTIPFVHSNFDREPDDHYPTIDPRCVSALLSAWDIPYKVWEPCAPNGSAIADQWPTKMIMGADALNDPVPIGCKSAVTNPPYTTTICNAITGRFRGLVADGQLTVAAFLLRSQWDHAKSRQALLGSEPFAGLVRLRFRPWWSEDRSKQPIHSYQWVVFDSRHKGPPIVKYAA
jgi:hypothetical protein